MTRPPWPLGRLVHLATGTVWLAACGLTTPPFTAPAPADEPALSTRWETDRTDVAAAFRLAVLYAESGRLEEARDVLSATVGAAPQVPETQVALGVVEQGLGEAAPADAAFRRALALQPLGGPMTDDVMTRLDALRPRTLRAGLEARARDARSARSTPNGGPLVAVLPLATRGDEDLAALATALVDLAGLRLAGLPGGVVDPLVSRTALDVMAGDADGVLSLEDLRGVAVLVGATHVVTARLRRPAPESLRIDGVVAAFSDASQVATASFVIEGAVGDAGVLDKRLALVVRGIVAGRLGASEVLELVDGPITPAGALVSFGRGLVALWGSDLDTAARAFGDAGRQDPSFDEAISLAARSSRARDVESAPIGETIARAARAWERSASVLALAGTSAPPLDAAEGLSRGGGAATELLGQDRLGAGTVIDLAFVIPPYQP